MPAPRGKGLRGAVRSAGDVRAGGALQDRHVVAGLALPREASAAADQSEQQMLNRYRAGQVGYTEVVTAQAAALNARRALLQLQVSRQVAAVELVRVMGGGWQAH